jgi:hypothetical protein
MTTNNIFKKCAPLFLRELPYMEQFEHSYSTYIQIVEQLQADKKHLARLAKECKPLLDMNETDQQKATHRVGYFPDYEPLYDSVLCTDLEDFLVLTEHLFITDFLDSEDTPYLMMEMRVNRLERLIADVRLLTNGIPVCYTFNDIHHLVCAVPHPEQVLVTR